MPKNSYKLNILVKAPLPFTDSAEQENPFETVDVICHKYRSLNRDLSDLECIECALEIVSAIWSKCGTICIYHIEPYENG